MDVANACVVGARALSPIIPKGDEATEPMETAAAPEAVSTDLANEEDPIKDTGMDAVDSATTDAPTENAADVEQAPVAGGLLTEAMVAEEEKLRQKTLEEETKMREEGEKQISDMEQEHREQRFKRLEFVLKKSNLYTSYLCERMERQKEEAEAACKRREARLKRKTERKKEQAQAETVSRETRSGGDKENVAQDSGVTQNKQADADLKSPPRARKSLRGTRSQTASPQVTGSNSSSQSPGNTNKRGRKRKAETLENYNIADYFNKALENTKKRKVDDEAAGQDKDSSQEEGTEKKEQDKLKTDISEALPVTNIDKILNAQENEEEDDEDALPVRYINGEQVSPDQPELFTGGVLRNYQIEGFQWLRVIYENGINGILADEMGLGKTIQCIAAISHLMRNGISGPFLVCAPLSTVPNWVSEFERFAPKLPVILYHGNKDQRAQLRRKMSKRQLIVDDVYSQPVVVTSYEIVMNDRKFMQNYEWKYIIVDEGHRIKNFQCRLIRELKMYKSTHRLLLTGTPLQNNLSELWSLLNFLLPEIFDDLTSFETWFDVEKLQSKDCHAAIVADEQRKSVLGMLHQILTPFMLRRLKSDVELAVPPKREVLVYAPLTSVQESFYKAAVNKTLDAMVKKKTKAAGTEQLPPVEYNAQGRAKRRACCKKVNYGMMMESEAEEEARLNDEEEDSEDIDEWADEVMKFHEQREQETRKSCVKPIHTSSVLHIKLQNILMVLRRACNHPYLLEYPLTPAGEFKIDEELINSCGKFLLLDRMLPELKRRDHKVLIFSQMTSMMDILEDYCYLRKYKYCRLDGNMGFEDRRDQIDQFNKDKQTFIFLLSTRAGGLGINLVAADTVIIYDSDWNPQCDLQAQDRAHRIGQTRPVMVYRIVTANTIDSKIVERAAAKRKLEKIVIHKGKFKEGLKSFTTEFKALDPQELLELLKANDFDEVVRGRDGHVISNRELNQLLDRSDLQKLWEAQKREKAGIAPPSRSVSPAQMEDVKGVFKVLNEEHDDFNVNTEDAEGGTAAKDPKETSENDESDKLSESADKSTKVTCADSKKDSVKDDEAEDAEVKSVEENNNDIKTSTVTEPSSESLVAES